MTVEQAHLAAQESQAAANEAAVLLAVVIVCAVVGLSVLARYLRWQAGRREAATVRHEAARAAGFAAWDFDSEAA